MTTLKQFTEEFLLWSEGAHRPNTVKANIQALKKFAAFVGQDIALKDIGARSADLFMAQQRKEGKKPSSVNNFYRHLKAAFRKAMAWEYLDKNPFDQVKALRRDKAEPVFLTKEQVSTFLDSIQDTDSRLIVTGYLATGRRRSELVGLKWADVNLEKKTYRIRAAKNHLTKDYPINYVFLAVLMQLPKDTEFVFQRWRHPDTVTHIIKKALVAAGYGEMHSHHLRHSFASMYLMGGGDIRSLMDLLGHSQITTTMVYSHLTKAHLAKEVDRVEFM